MWSALKYSCHIREVYRIFGLRLELMRTMQDPEFAKDLAAAGEELARTFQRIRPAEWRRTGRRSNGSVFTVHSLGCDCLHDDIHHLFDVGEHLILPNARQERVGPASNR